MLTLTISMFLTMNKNSRQLQMLISIWVEQQDQEINQLQIMLTVLGRAQISKIRSKILRMMEMDSLLLVLTPMRQRIRRKV